MLPGLKWDKGEERETDWYLSCFFCLGPKNLASSVSLIFFASSNFICFQAALNIHCVARASTIRWDWNIIFWGQIVTQVQCSSMCIYLLQLGLQRLVVKWKKTSVSRRNGFLESVDTIWYRAEARLFHGVLNWTKSPGPNADNQMTRMFEWQLFIFWLISKAVPNKSDEIDVHSSSSQAGID